MGATLTVYAQDRSVELTPVVITDIPLAQRPSYRVDRTKVGPIGQRELFNAPHSIASVPVSLAEN